MGYGDSLMASAEVKYINKLTGKKVAIGDGINLKLKTPDLEIFHNNPKIVKTQKEADRNQNIHWIRNYSGFRPYQDRDRMVKEFYEIWPDKKFTMKVRDSRLPWRWSNWAVADFGPGEIYFDKDEKQEALKFVRKDFVVIEPNIKNGTSPNKFWSIEKYQQVVNFLIDKNFEVIQFKVGAYRLKNVREIYTSNFRLACALLEHAKLYVGNEGGLHHASAALNVPAVIYYGGYTLPSMTGYHGQRFLFREDGSPCGQRVECEHCREISKQITAEEMINEIEGVLNA